MEFFAVNNFGDTRSGGLAGPMGLFIIVLLAIATVLLIRNMNKRLRRLPDSFDKIDASKAAAEPVRRDATVTSTDITSSVDGDRSGTASGVAPTQVNEPGAPRAAKPGDTGPV